MSEPTYRIELEHQPQWKSEPWQFTVRAQSDDSMVTMGWGSTKAKAIEHGREAIARMHRQEPSETVYATETGELMEQAQ